MPISELSVAPGNQAQAQAWDGDEGEIWARHPGFFHDSVRLHQARLMRAAAVPTDARVLDVGCGTGDVTCDAARAARQGSVTGIDLSSAMLRRARELAASEGIRNVTFLHGDAQQLAFEPASFDLVISRTGTMFFADQVAAFTNIASAVRPGGRLALMSWQGPERNEWFLAFVEAMTLGRGLAPPPADAPSPFAHADPTRTEGILTAAGFTEVAFEPLELPMYFGATVDEGHRILGELLAWMAGDLDPDERVRAFDRLRDTLEAHETRDGPAFGSGAWLITARRP
jgi:SAM-dependent methyltransferase